MRITCFVLGRETLLVGSRWVRYCLTLKYFLTIELLRQWRLVIAIFKFVQRSKGVIDTSALYQGLKKYKIPSNIALPQMQSQGSNPHSYSGGIPPSATEPDTSFIPPQVNQLLVVCLKPPAAIIKAVVAICRVVCVSTILALPSALIVKV